jgi:hypothetical protein
MIAAMVVMTVAVVMKMVVVVLVMPFVAVMVIMLVFQMNIELDPFDCGFRIAPKVEVVAFYAELRQFMLEGMEIDAEVEQRADEHVAADAGKNIEIQSFHSRSARRLI